MFCIKCGKKLERPGLCRFCGEKNTTVSEHNYFKSPEIELLLRDDEDFLLMKGNAAPHKDMRQENVQTKPKSAVRNAPDAAKKSDLTAAEKKIVPAAKAPESTVPPKYGQSVPAAARAAVSETRSMSYDSKSSGKRRIIAACALLIAAAAVVTGIILVKNKKEKNDGDRSSVSSSDSRNDREEPTDILGDTTLPGETPAAAETTTAGSTSATEMTTDPEEATEPEQEKGPIRVAVISAYSSGNNIVNDMKNSLFTEANGFVCNDLNIAEEEIDPQNYDMIVLPMPTTDFAPEQIEKLEKFLEDDNKNLLYIPAMSDVETANINKFLEEWDIEVGDTGFLYNESDGCYINDENSAYNYGYNIRLSVDDEKSTDIIAPMTKEITADDSSKRITKVLKAPDQSKIAEISGKDAEGKADDRCAAVIAASDDNKNHIIVFGSSEMFSSKYIDKEQYANKDVILGILKTAAGRESSSGDSDN